MTAMPFSEEDLRQIQAHGLTLDQVREYLRLFARPPRFIRLSRPAIQGDGVYQIPPGEVDTCLARHAEAASLGRFTKFVPASGAATRMFEVLLHYHYHMEADLEAALEADLARGEPRAREFMVFHKCLPHFAFWGDLRALLANHGHDVEELLAARYHREIHSLLLTPEGLHYPNLPKALIKFHGYEEESRTALEEHLVEAAAYVRDQEGVCRLHFTILNRHREEFQRVLDRVQPILEERYRCRFEVEVSLQHPGSDTLAADAENRPFRDSQGRLVFRPGGHGAVLQNLNEFQGDLVYIKNIDNVVPDRLKDPTIHWKKVLGGYLVFLQEQVHHYLEQILKNSGRPGLLQETLEFARERLSLAFSPGILQWPEDLASDFVVKVLNRPLRVCGVVLNEGEPGGAPFWVEESDGSLSLQIVEKAQVELSSPAQKAIWESSTHFNPVDLVCALRDDQDVPFDLSQYVDREAVFISRKSLDGRELKALELPGLWNGGMARWLTVFVEVPIITFNPVKTVFDLLRPEHQPEGIPLPRERPAHVP